MKILVIGGGGREHAIVRKLRESPACTQVYVLPGNAGMEGEAEPVDIRATDLPAIVRFAREKGIGYAVVTPDDPLVMGLVDELEAVGVPCFGPRKNAAIIEGSKVFAKDLMRRYGIPTARCEVFERLEDALAYVRVAPVPVVVKADGLALGKGVVIAFTREEAEGAVRSAMIDGAFGASGSRIVVEEFLEGPEVSVLAFTDGTTLVPMVSSMDHKRAGDGDTGPNTGGMGTVAPNPFYTGEMQERCMREIFMPTLRAMKAEGREFRGCLYFGLMLTREGPKVIEYNCRFGDPETQVVLPLLEGDLLEIMQAVTRGELDRVKVRFSDQAACCVVLASRGYPRSSDKGRVITLPDAVKPYVYVAGAARKDGQLVTAGGRVLGVSAVAPTLQEAVDLAYRRADQVRFDGAFCRRDIGRRALDALRNPRI